MKSPPRTPRPRPPRSVVTALALLALTLAPTAARAQTDLSYEQDVRFAYEYDDNVNEDLRDEVRAQVARLSYRGDLRWGASGEQRLTLTYQGGFKRHFGLTPQDLDLASQFVNEGEVGYLRRIGPALALGGSFGLKNRSWTDEFFFINEDGFTSASATVNGILNLKPLAPERPVRLELGGRWGTTDFDNLDQTFGNDVWGGYVALSKRFDEDISASWSYSLDRIRYPGRGTVEPDDEIPSNAFTGPTRPRQEDLQHEVGLALTWLGDVSVQADYRYRFVDSNSFGFTYQSHNVGLQLLRRFPWDMLAQFYGQVELRSFSEPVPNLTGAGTLDTGDAANNVFLLRFVKDVTPNSSIEARYGWYRNESITLNDFYTKNIYSIGIIVRP